jgi:hypothetical protein
MFCVSTFYRRVVPSFGTSTGTRLHLRRNSNKKKKLCIENQQTKKEKIILFLFGPCFLCQPSVLKKAFLCQLGWFWQLCCLALASWVAVIVADSNTTAASWVVIVAGSNGYQNYRHQADACHAYQVVAALCKKDFIRLHVTGFNWEWHP